MKFLPDDWAFWFRVLSVLAVVGALALLLGIGYGGAWIWDHLKITIK